MKRVNRECSAADDHYSDCNDEEDSKTHEQRLRCTVRQTEPSKRKHRKQQPAGIKDQTVKYFEKACEAQIVAFCLVPSIDRSFGPREKATEQTRGHNHKNYSSDEFAKSDSDAGLGLCID